MTDRLIAFPPVARADARILILGSMPSAASLAQGFYYGHPRNAFWHILSDVSDRPLPETVSEKTSLLLDHRLALWDVLRSCVREGSLDGAIRDMEVNDFQSLFERCPGIDRVLLNGGTAKRVFLRYGASFLEGRTWLVLPSTSPAYTISYERKLAQWRHALQYEHQSM